MKLHGLQKMTLLDFPGHVACTVFLGGCDFRCPFCHNFQLAEGREAPGMDDDELLRFLSGRKGLLDGVAFTGGEPCLHRELPRLLERIREMGYAVKLDTNGYHPDLLGEILNKKLADYVAMDVKNSPEKYAETCGVAAVDLDVITRSIRTIMDSGADYEFRTTVVRELHEERDFAAIGQMIQGAKRYFLQAFTDRDTVPFEGFHAPDKASLERFAAAARPFVDCVSLRGVD